MKIRNFIRIIAGVMVAVLTFVRCSSENEYNIFAIIEGTISDYSTGNAIENATITLSPGNTSVRSDETGYFVFTDVDAQNYTITVQKNEYQPNRRNVVALSGETITVNIPLTKINK